MNSRICLAVFASLGTLAWLRATPAQANAAPVVTNVTATQIANTGQVRVTFDVSDAEGDLVTARLICSSDNGITYDLLPVTLSGDVNRTMAAGPGKEIIWDAANDYPGRYWTQVVAKVFVSDGPSLGGEMVAIPPGSFTMGSNTTPGAYEYPAHTVTLDAYEIDKYEVTNANYQRFIDAGGYSTQAFWSAAGWAWRVQNNRVQPAYWSTGSYHNGPAWPDFPVSVSWYEAEAYASFVGKRLPTEAEWERAARGAAGWLFPWGNNYESNRTNGFGDGDPFEPGSSPVGFFDGRLFPNPPYQTVNSPGPYGTYDQGGNVLEWVHDWFQADYYATSPTSNPLGPISGTFKVLRGGSWKYENTESYHEISSIRRGVHKPPMAEYFFVGFRCARDLP